MRAPRPVLDHHAGGQRATDRDERNRAYGITRLVPDAPPDRSVFWTPGTQLDQGDTGHCGGFAAAGEAAASPVRVRGVDNDYAHRYYYEIKDRHLDPWGREDGTSTQAVMDLYVRRGLAGGYAWGFDIPDLYRQLTVGPVLCGTSWLTRMFYPDEDGVVWAAGSDEGGHLWLCTGRYKNYRGPTGKTYGPAIRIRNSWGDWGRNGSAILLEGGARHILFDLNGEVGVPTSRAFPPA